MDGRDGHDFTPSYHSRDRAGKNPADAAGRGPICRRRRQSGDAGRQLGGCRETARETARGTAGDSSRDSGRQLGGQRETAREIAVPLPGPPTRRAPGRRAANVTSREAASHPSGSGPAAVRPRSRPRPRPARTEPLLAGRRSAARFDKGAVRPGGGSPRLI